jgi:hypothetical protein
MFTHITLILSIVYPIEYYLYSLEVAKILNIDETVHFYLKLHFFAILVMMVTSSFSKLAIMLFTPAYIYYFVKWYKLIGLFNEDASILPMVFFFSAYYYGQ